MADYKNSQKLEISRSQLNSLLAGIYYRRIAQARNKLSESHDGTPTKDCLVDYNGEPHYRAIRSILQGEDPWGYIQSKDANGEYILPFIDGILNEYELFVESSPEDLAITNGEFARRALMLRKRRT